MGSIEELIREFLPPPRLVLLLAPLAAIYAAAAAWFAGWLRTKRGMRAPYTRKVFHFSIFTMAGIVHLVWDLHGVVIFGSVVALAVLYACWKGDDFPFYEAMARLTDAPHRTLFIIVPLITTALGGVVSNLFFGDLAFIGYLVAGWGDAVGEPVGTRWGKHRYKVPSLAGVPATRSLEGSSAVFFMGATAAVLGLWLGGLAPAEALKVGVLCGLAGMAIEAISSHGLDNFTVQVAGAATAFFLVT